MKYYFNKFILLCIFIQSVINIFSCLQACDMERMHFDCIDSTYSCAQSLGSSNSWRVVTANQQTRGVERVSSQESTSWVSPRAGNLYSTYVVPTPEYKAPLMIGAPQVASVAVAQTLDHFGLKPQIKWPNDIFVNDKKISGIGASLDFPPFGDPLSLINVNLNINMNKQLCKTINQPATSMAVAAKKQFNEDAVLSVLNQNMYKNITAAQDEKFTTTSLPYLKQHMTGIGKEITVNNADVKNKDERLNTLTGIFKGLSDDGSMILTKGGEDYEIFNGSVLKEPKLKEPKNKLIGIIGQEQQERGRPPEKQLGISRPKTPSPIKDTLIREGLSSLKSGLEYVYKAREEGTTFGDKALGTLAYGLDGLSIAHDVLDSASLGTLSKVEKTIDIIAEEASTFTRRTVRELTDDQRLGQNVGDCVYAATNIIGTKKVFGVAQIVKEAVLATEAVKAVDMGLVWGKGIQAQGMPWENHLAKQFSQEARLPQNFKTFDFYDKPTGLAVSAKTLNTMSASRLNDPIKIYHSLTKSIDAVANFEHHKLSGVKVRGENIKIRQLEVGVPAATTEQQWAQIEKAIEYAQEKNIIINITKIQ
jgi:biotin-[acetyl-CoA-carboxylase] ligase BirA-like protein